jgi:hypothetical protein
VRARPKTIVHCTQCGDPINIAYGEALGFDTEWLLCRGCKPKASKPRVTLFGAPDGQELGRWS